MYKYFISDILLTVLAVSLQDQKCVTVDAFLFICVTPYPNSSWDLRKYAKIKDT